MNSLLNDKVYFLIRKQITSLRFLAWLETSQLYILSYVSLNMIQFTLIKL